MDNIYEEFLIKQDTVLIIADASFKNNITTSVSHIWRGQEIIAKLVHHTSNVSSTEAKIFTIRCGINYAMKLQDISCIIVITDAIPAAKQVFDTSTHLHSIAVSKDLKSFFNKSLDNTIKFWDCPDSIKWPPQSLVDRDIKCLKINPIFPSKSSWEVDRKKECDSIIHKWQMMFQASEFKGRNFLELNDDDHNPIHPTYSLSDFSKGGAWMKFCGTSNSLCA